MEARGTPMAICRECRLLLRGTQKVRHSPFAATATLARPPLAIRSFTTTPSSTRGGSKSDTQTSYARTQRIHASTTPTTTNRPNPPATAPLPAKDLASVHARILDLTATALHPEDHQPPSEQRILYVLEQLQALATNLTDAKTIGAAKAARDAESTDDAAAADRSDTATATSALLGSVNNPHHRARGRSSIAHLTRASLLNTLSSCAEEILRDRDVRITSAVLAAYVTLQSSVHAPSSFPDIFHLYAHKPVPAKSKRTGETAYSPPSRSASSPTLAIPTATATTALHAAIRTHNLPLTLDVISTTFSTPAFQRNKLLQRALLPTAILTLTPPLAYAASTAFSTLQTTMSTPYATGVAFAGIMTYLATVAGLGYVVLTTANDQMERVTWARGVPLWERWVREEERRALDEVACAWGFREVERRGEEGGEAWEGLRESVGRRGMVLDEVGLMEGME